MGYVERFYAALMPLLEPLTYSNGGPIIMLQVENEYGYYGSDHNYLNNLQDIMEVTYGLDVLYFASNGYYDL
jgi:beta-galactosidase